MNKWKGNWYEPLDKNADYYNFRKKYYYPFKIIKVKGNVCTCKGIHSLYTWTWTKKDIKENNKQLSKSQIFEEML
jgi:hypothetical protein